MTSVALLQNPCVGREQVTKEKNIYGSLAGRMDRRSQQSYSLRDYSRADAAACWQLPRALRCLSG